MALRVNPDWTSTLLFAINTSRAAEDRALAQMASGRRVNTLSEDPAAAASFVYNRAAEADNTQFLRNITALRGQFSSAEEALNSSVNAVTRAIALAVQGFTSSTATQGRLVVAAELRGIREQLIALANASYQGNYLFAGTEDSTPPFALDGTEPSGVRYDGNTAFNAVEINHGHRIATNLPGSQIFADPQGDIFQAITDVITALENDDISAGDALTSAVRQAFDHLQGQRAVYGNLLSQLNSVELVLNRQTVELARQETELVGADLAKSASDLVNANRAREAALAAGAKISQTSLLDYLR
jgi:flagellar hook-associated protein 3 FlgL